MTRGVVVVIALLCGAASSALGARPALRSRVSRPHSRTPPASPAVPLIGGRGGSTRLQAKVRRALALSADEPALLVDGTNVLGATSFRLREDELVAHLSAWSARARLPERILVAFDGGDALRAQLVAGAADGARVAVVRAGPAHSADDVLAASARWLAARARAAPRVVSSDQGLLRACGCVAAVGAHAFAAAVRAPTPPLVSAAEAARASDGSRVLHELVNHLGRGQLPTPPPPPATAAVARSNARARRARAAVSMLGSGGARSPTGPPAPSGGEGEAGSPSGAALAALSTPRLLPLLAVCGALLGPCLDGYHGAFGVLRYYPPLALSLPLGRWYCAADGELHTALWVPPLFALAAVLIGGLYVGLDAATATPGDGSTRTRPVLPAPSAPHTLRAISFFTAQYWLSGLLWASGVRDVGVVGGVLGASALASWWLFDRTLVGAAVGVATAVGGPLIELGLINGAPLLLGGAGRLYEYVDADFYGIDWWIPLVYFGGAPAVGSLARCLRAALAED